MKEEALKLADEWDWMTEEKLAKWGDDAQAMIRRLVEELYKQIYKADLLENRLKVLVGTKPLSDEEIYEIGKQYLTQYEDGLIDFVRAIKERHGIK